MSFKTWITKVLHHTPESVDDRVLTLQSRIAELELQLREAETSIAALQREAAERAATFTSQMDQRLTDKFADLTNSLATPLLQLMAMKAFVVSGRTIDAGDVLKVAARILTELTRFGIFPIGDVDQEVPFEPAKHQPSGGATPIPGDLVRIDLPGFMLGDRILRRAIVKVTPGAHT